MFNIKQYKIMIIQIIRFQHGTFVAKKMFKDNKYNLKEAKVNYKWDEFLERSGNPNPYVSSDFLNSLDLNKKLCSV